MVFIWTSLTQLLVNHSDSPTDKNRKHSQNSCYPHFVHGGDMFYPRMRKNELKQMGVNITVLTCLYVRIVILESYYLQFKLVPINAQDSQIKPPITIVGMVGGLNSFYLHCMELPILIHRHFSIEHCFLYEGNPHNSHCFSFSWVKSDRVDKYQNLRILYNFYQKYHSEQ